MKRWQVIVAAVAVTLAVAVAFVGGAQCGGGCDPEPVDPARGIDASAGEREIDARLDASVQRARERLREIEQKYEEDIEAFEQEQREEYERVRQGSLEDIARYLNEWHRHRRSQ